MAHILVLRSQLMTAFCFVTPLVMCVGYRLVACAALLMAHILVLRSQLMTAFCFVTPLPMSVSSCRLFATESRIVLGSLLSYEGEKAETEDGSISSPH